MIFTRLQPGALTVVYGLAALHGGWLDSSWQDREEEHHPWAGPLEVAFGQGG